MLPRKLKPPKMGVRPLPRKVWRRHRRWVKSHGCCVPHCPAAVIEFAHLRSAANAGTAQKPHDMFGVSLCRVHHDEQHASRRRVRPQTPHRSMGTCCRVRSA